MILSKKQFILSQNKTIKDALNLIQDNEYKICFLLNDKNHLVKSVTDGDIRRALISGHDLNSKLTHVGKSDYKFIRFENEINSEIKKISKFGNNIYPIIDDKKTCKDIFLYEKFDDEQNIDKKIFILGLGYVGLTLGLVLAENGYEVLGFDNNIDISKKLKSKKPTFFENGIEEYLDRYIGNKFKILNTPKYIADIHIISVGTPLIKNSKIPNMNYLKSALDIVSKNIKLNDLVILRSTVPIGTTRDIVIPYIERISKLKFGKDIFLSFCPERTVEGLALKELKSLPQIVGAYDDRSYKMSSLLFNKYTSTIRCSSLEGGEIAKLIDNSYRDVIFGYANQMALISSKYNLDINDIIDKINLGYKRNSVPKPSPGVGGPCLSKDPYLLNYSFKKFKLEASLSLAARNISDQIIEKIYKDVEIFLKENSIIKKNIKILISGIAFKGQPETSDIRGSTALDLINIFKKKKFKNIFLHDFCVPKNDLKIHGRVMNKLGSGFSEFDIIIVMNNHSKYFNLNLYDFLKKRKKKLLLYDTWNVLNIEVIKDFKNLKYLTIGNNRN